MVIMNESSDLEVLLNQLSNLYQQILTNQNKKMTISPEIREAVQKVSREIENIQRETDLGIARQGVTAEMLKKTILGPKSQIPSDLQDLLKKSQFLKSQLEGCRNTLKDTIKKQKEEKGLTKKRQEKFKNLGGKKGWIPL